MKKLKLLLICMLFFTTRIYASEVAFSFDGDTSIKENETSSINVYLNCDEKIDLVNIGYYVSDNMQTINIKNGPNYNISSLTGTKYTLTIDEYRTGLVALQFDIKASKTGYGYLTVYGNAVIDGQTIEIDKKTIAIKIYNKDGIDEKNATISDNQKYGEIESEEDLVNYKKALTLVDSVEKTLNSNDFQNALDTVLDLKESDNKILLLERLENIRHDILVKEEVKNYINDEYNIDDTIKCNNDSKEWIIICGILVLALVFETIYVLYRIKKIEG